MTAETSENLRSEDKSARLAAEKLSSQFAPCLHKLKEDSHPGMSVRPDVFPYLDGLLVSLLRQILSARPRNVSDVEKIIHTFPRPLNDYAIDEARVQISRPFSLRFHRTHVFQFGPLVHKLQQAVKEHMSIKLDSQAATFVLGAMEYVAQDILKLSGNFVRNIRSEQMTLEDLKVAIRADWVLSELLSNTPYNDDTVSPTVIPIEQPVSGDRTFSGNNQMEVYEQVVRDVVASEEAYLKRLQLISYVFRQALMDLAPRVSNEDIEAIFSNLQELLDISTRIKSALEDAIESGDSARTSAGGVLLMELGEGMDYEAFIRYGKNVMSGRASEVIERLLKDSSVRHALKDWSILLRSCEGACHTFNWDKGDNNMDLAVGYLLPQLLMLPIAHAVQYVDRVQQLSAATSKNDQNELADLRAAGSHFKSMLSKMDGAFGENNLKRVCSEVPGVIAPLGGVRGYKRAQVTAAVRRVEGLDISMLSKHSCTEFVWEGPLWRLRDSNTPRLPLSTALDKFKERHCFLFDGAIVFAKKIEGKRNQDGDTMYRLKGLKEIYPLRNLDVIDHDDSACLKNSFELAPRGTNSSNILNVGQAPIFGASVSNQVSPGIFLNSSESILVAAVDCEDKKKWMASLLMLLHRNMYDRLLDTYKKKEQNRFPLILPHPNQYRFSEPDSEENIIFENYTSNSGVPVVRAATFVKLVERLTYHTYVDMKYMQTFLTTYRSFFQPKQLLELLIERFIIPTPLELQMAGMPSSAGGLAKNATANSLNFPSNDIISICETPSLAQIEAAFNFSTGMNSDSFSIANDSMNLDPSQCLNSSRAEIMYARFRKEFVQPVQMRVLNALCHWVSKHWYDFANDPELVSTLVAFLQSVRGRTLKKNADAILSRVRKLQTETDENSDVNKQQPSATAALRARVFDAERKEQFLIANRDTIPPVLWHTANPGCIEEYNLLSLHPLEVARQLTLIEAEMYRTVQPIELVDAAWMKKDKESRSQQLLQLIDFSNRLTYWLEMQIVSCKNVEDRAAMCERILDIMCALEGLNNFNGMMECFSALHSAPVHRLKVLGIPDCGTKCAELFKRFSVMFDYKAQGYRAALRSCDPPCVPFFGHFLNTIFFLVEGQPTYFDCSTDLIEDDDDIDGLTLPAKLISFHKCRKISEIIRDIQMYQDGLYALREEPSIRSFFESLNPVKDFEKCPDPKRELENYLYEQSCQIEPRGALPSETANHPSQFDQRTLKSPGIKSPPIAAPSTNSKKAHWQSRQQPSTSHGAGTNSYGAAPNFHGASASGTLSRLGKSTSGGKHRDQDNSASVGKIKDWSDDFAVVEITQGKPSVVISERVTSETRQQLQMQSQRADQHNSDTSRPPALSPRSPMNFSTGRHTLPRSHPDNRRPPPRPPKRINTVPESQGTSVSSPREANVRLQHPPPRPARVKNGRGSASPEGSLSPRTAVTPGCGSIKSRTCSFNNGLPTNQHRAPDDRRNVFQFPPPVPDRTKKPGKSRHFSGESAAEKSECESPSRKSPPTAATIENSISFEIKSPEIQGEMHKQVPNKSQASQLVPPMRLKPNLGAALPQPLSPRSWESRVNEGTLPSSSSAPSAVANNRAGQTQGQVIVVNDNGSEENSGEAVPPPLPPRQAPARLHYVAGTELSAIISQHSQNETSQPESSSLFLPPAPPILAPRRSASCLAPTPVNGAAKACRCELCTPPPRPPKNFAR